MSGVDRGRLACRITTDVDRLAPLLARILLVRAVWNIRHHCGGHSLWVARDMASDCREELKAAGATTRVLARALVPDHDVDHDLTTAIAGADRLSAAMTREGNTYSDYHQATDPDTYIDQQRAGELWKQWQEQKDHVNDALRGLPTDLGSGKTGSMLLDRALDRVFERGLCYEIRHSLFSGAPERAWRRRVAGVLCDAARVRQVRGNATATCGDLADSLRAGRRALDDTAPQRLGAARREPPRRDRDPGVHRAGTAHGRQGHRDPADGTVPGPRTEGRPDPRSRQTLPWHRHRNHLDGAGNRRRNP